MARQSPTGFAFSMLIEIAAVVVIVSLLPRFDLRPKASANAASRSDSKALEPPTLLTSFQRPGFADRRWPAPPLIEPPVHREYVEQRLDEASQQLVNTVGSAVSSLASDLTEAIRPAPQQPAAAADLSPPERQVTLLPPVANAAPPPPPAGSFQTQPRPWLRY